MKKILVISILFFFFASTYGQKEANVKTRKYLGVNIGATTGIGISYKQWFNDFGFQITGLPFKIQDDLDYSIGFMAFYSIKKRRYVNYFGYAGANYMTDGFDFIFEYPMYDYAGIKHKNKEYYNHSTYSYTYEYNDANYFNISGGLGVELGKNPLVTAMLGYAAFDLTEDYKLFPTIELGLHFKLK